MACHIRRSTEPLRIWARQPFLVGHEASWARVRKAQLGQDVIHVSLDGPDRDMQLACDLAI
jgi:hypothetical protein